MASDDEMPILTTEETGELEMPRLEAEGKHGLDIGLTKPILSSSKKIEKNNTPSTLAEVLKMTVTTKNFDEDFFEAQQNFNELYEKTCIYDHEDVIREREKQFEKSGKNEWVLASTIFPGLKYRYILNGCNRGKTLRFYSCYGCIMMKKIPFYKDLIDLEAPIPTIVVENGRINNINADRPNDVAHLCTPRLTIARRGTNMLVDLSKVSCQFPSNTTKKTPANKDDKVVYTSKFVSLDYEFYCESDKEFDKNKTKKICVLTCLGCEKAKKSLLAVYREMAVYVPQMFFQDGLFVHVNPDMPLNALHLCVKNFLDMSKQKMAEAIQTSNGNSDEKIRWKTVPTEQVKYFESSPSTSLSDLRTEKESGKQPRMIKISEISDSKKFIFEKEKTRRAMELRLTLDQEAARIRMHGVKLTADDLQKYGVASKNTGSDRLRSSSKKTAKKVVPSGVEDSIMKLIQSDDNVQEDSIPFSDVYIKEEPKVDLDEQPKTINDLLLNLCSENSRDVDESREFEEPPNLTDEITPSESLQVQMRAQMVQNTVAQFLHENAGNLRPSRVPIEKKLGLKIAEKNNPKKTSSYDIDRHIGIEITTNTIGNRASTKTERPDEPKVLEVPFLKEIKQEMDIDSETSEFVLDNQGPSTIETIQVKSDVMSNLLLTKPNPTYMNELVMRKLTSDEPHTYVLKRCRLKISNENMLVYESLAYADKLIFMENENEHQDGTKIFVCRDCDYLQQRSFVKYNICIPKISVWEEDHVPKTHADPDFPNQLIHYCRLKKAKVLLSNANLPKIKKNSRSSHMDDDKDVPPMLEDQSPPKPGNPLQLLHTAINAIHNKNFLEPNDDYIEETLSVSENDDNLPSSKKHQPFKRKRGRPPKNTLADEPPTKRSNTRYSLRETIKQKKIETPDLESEEEPDNETSLVKILSTSEISLDTSNQPCSSSFTSTPARERDVRKIAAQNWKLKQKKIPMKETPISKMLNRLNFGNDYSAYTIVFVEAEKFPGLEFIFMYDPSSREYLCTACQNAITYAQLMKWSADFHPARLSVSDFGILTPPDDDLHVCLPKKFDHQPTSSARRISVEKITNTPGTSGIPTVGPRILKINKPRFVPVKLSDLEKVGSPKTKILETEDMPKLLPPELVDDSDIKSDSSEPPELSAFPKAPTLRFLPVNTPQTQPKFTIVRSSPPSTDHIAKRPKMPYPGT